ncbi:MAG: SIS domain-containing protein [Candidatus Paceibacterota bacterium]|jgi:D-sedoheptulose 7-phosphate isomerase
MMPFTQYSGELQTFLERVVITDSNGQNVNIDEGLSLIITLLHKIKTTRKKVMVIGNGGSAAIASHLQNDLCKAAQIRVMVFTEPPLLTALSNDISYTAAYRELVNLWADNDDVLIAISSSGRSQNILNAVTTARDHGCTPIITVSGFLPDNPLRRMGDLNLYVSSREYGYVELVHSVLTHYISDQTAKTE